MQASALAGQPDPDTETILKTSGIHGGPCLIVAATDLPAAPALAEKSNLSVLVLQPDGPKAAEWSGEIATGWVN